MKKDKLDKEHVPKWSKQVYTVEDVLDYDSQNFYVISGYHKPVLRSELYRVPNQFIYYQ